MAQIEKLHCRGCGAVLPVRAKAGRIKCEYCGTVHLADTEQKRDSGDLACPTCGFPNPPQAEYCGDCGRSFFHTCPKCGTQNRMESVFCVKCGADVEKAISEEGPHKNINIDDLYTDYLLEGKRLYTEVNQSTILPSLLSGILLGGAFLIWLFDYVDAFDLSKYVQYVPVMGVLGFALMIISSNIYSIKRKAGAARIAKNKPGFDKFYKTIRQTGRRPGGEGVFNWPDILPDEKKRKEFLFLIGQK